MSAARLPVPYAVVSQGKLVLSASGFRSVAMINVGWKKRAEMCILNINRAKVEVSSLTSVVIIRVSYSYRLKQESESICISSHDL